METRSRTIRIAIIAVIVIFIYAITRCGNSKAEEIHYGPEMNTPDPNTGVYDVIESDPPEPPYVPDLTFYPVPFPTSDPDSPNAMPYSVNLKYDPFLAFINANTGLINYKRLNGTVTTVVPPISTSILHQAVATSYSNVDPDNPESYIKYLDYECDVSGVSQSTTSHEYGQASLIYILTQSFSTNNAGYRITPNDHIAWNISPNIKMLCTESDYLFSPSAEIHLQLTLKSTSSNISSSRNVYFDYVIPNLLNDGTDTFYIDINLSDYAEEALEYVQSYFMTIVINPIDGISVGPDPIDQVRDVVLPEYYYTQVDDPYVQVAVWASQSERSFLSGLFGGIQNFISNIFVPDETMVQEWIELHTSDELDVDNPLNMVKDIFVNMMDFFSGNITGRVVIDVPALSFNVNNQKVTPFEGYEWRIDAVDMTPTDGSGRSIWYYVKLANSCVIAAGFIDLLWNYFKKWYDAHYAGGPS